MTGGTTASDGAKTSRWDERALEGMQDCKQELEAERSTLGRSEASRRSSLEHSGHFDELRNSLQNLRDRMDNSSSEKDFTRQQRAQKNILLKGIDKKLPPLEQRVAEAEEAFKQCNEMCR